MPFSVQFLPKGKKRNSIKKKKKFAQLDFTLQPFIIIVEQNIAEITHIYIYVNNTEYVLNSTVAVIDCCLKVIYALNFEYLLECLSFWTFIQKVF